VSTGTGSAASPRERPAGVAARALLLLIEVYRVTLAPLIGGFCRYVPSCSVYAEEAVRRHGAAAGTKLAARRLLRCHPFHRGGFDPVP
jgi:putative membrane protein insertion efficiency factor